MSRHLRHEIGSNWRMLLTFLFVIFLSPADTLIAQTASQESLSQQIQKLTDAMEKTQVQLEQSQRQLNELQRELNELRQQMPPNQATAIPPSPSATPAASSHTGDAAQDIASAIRDVRERQTMQESQIATHEQTKVETESKYPLKITGLLLLTGFVNTGAVDMPATPTVALPGSGSTGATLRQTVLGFDARGPHLFGAESYADLRVDFDGLPQPAIPASTYTGTYSANATFLRLRTAHAGLRWKHSETYFSLDRPIFNPDFPTSLTAVAVPPLAWSGNLWTWNPQIGVKEELSIAHSRDIQMQAALIDVGDAPLSPSGYSSLGNPISGAEQSRWPGVEAHVALLGARRKDENRSDLGVGGYFASHRVLDGQTFNSWAGTLDTRLILPARLELSGSFYRGLALGGLGGGAFKDFAYRKSLDSNSYYVRPLDDVGGWAQLTERINERVELNAALGVDNVFAGELQRYGVVGGTVYQNLARNFTYTGNVIYSPSAYLLFSLEYRHLESSPILSLPASSNVIGLGAGFKF